MGIRAALIRNSKVETVTIFNDAGVTTWGGFQVVYSDTANVGDTWNGSTFSTPAPVVPTPTRLEVLAAITANYTTAQTQELLHLLALKAARS